jgi:hypothetical protein
MSISAEYDYYSKLKWMTIDKSLGSVLKSELAAKPTSATSSAVSSWSWIMHGSRKCDVNNRFLTPFVISYVANLVCLNHWHFIYIKKEVQKILNRLCHIQGFWEPTRDLSFPILALFLTELDDGVKCTRHSGTSFTGAKSSAFGLLISNLCFMLLWAHVFMMASKLPLSFGACCKDESALRNMHDE